MTNNSNVNFLLCGLANIPQNLTFEKQYSLIYGCGINTVMGVAESALRYTAEADRFELKYIALNEKAQEEIENNSQDFSTVIGQIKSYSAAPSHIGDIVAACPDDNMFNGIKEVTALYTKNFPNKICAAEISINQKNLEEYIDNFIQTIKPKTIFFGICAHSNINEDYFYNLDIIRKKLTESNIPFITGIDTTLEVKNPLSLRAFVRWQAFSALAMGAKGINYGYIYPSKKERGIITNDGEKTSLYGYIEELNEDIKKTAEILHCCKSEGVFAGEGIRLYKQPLDDFYPVKYIEGKDFLAGCFSCEKGRKKILLTNALPCQECTVVFTLDAGVSIANVCIGTSSFALTPKENKLDININAGDAVLIEFEV